ADRFVGTTESDEHPTEIEGGDPESRLTVRRLLVLGGCGLQLVLPLENLPEVVVRLRVPRVDRNRFPVRGCGRLPFLLKPEQHAVVVVRVAQIEAERDDSTVLLLRLRPVVHAAVP